MPDAELRTPESKTTAARGRIVLELFDLAAGMVAERFRREHPGATDGEVEAAVEEWANDRPGAPFGDYSSR